MSILLLLLFAKITFIVYCAVVCWVLDESAAATVISWHRGSTSAMTVFVVCLRCASLSPSLAHTMLSLLSSGIAAHSLRSLSLSLSNYDDDSSRRWKVA